MKKKKEKKKLLKSPGASDFPQASLFLLFPRFLPEHTILTLHMFNLEIRLRIFQTYKTRLLHSLGFWAVGKMASLSKTCFSPFLTSDKTVSIQGYVFGRTFLSLQNIVHKI